MNYIVYKTTNLINGHIYIGVHYSDMTEKDTYIGCGVTKKDKKNKVLTGFPAAVRKYGYSNFKRETLFIFPDTEDGKRDAYKKEAELVNEEFIAREDTYNLCLGGIIPPTEQFKKKIVQYDLDGNFIKIWDSITDAETSLKISGIYNALCGKYNVVGTSQWSYYDGSADNISKVKVKEKTVYQFDLQGNLLKVHKSISEASKQFENCDSARSGISQNCLKKKSQFNGFYWSFKNKFEFTPVNFLKQQIPVAKYNDEGEFLKSYDSLTEAAKEVGGNISNITAAIKGKQKRCGGYRWRYFYGNTSNIKPLR